MKDLKNWAIAILGIVCLGLYWLAQHKQDQLYTVEQTAIQMRIEYGMYVHATEALLDEVCDYVEDKYEEYLPDTIWEGDLYDEYAFAYELVKSKYNVQVK